jgi:hypothetical protein
VSPGLFLHPPRKPTVIAPSATQTKASSVSELEPTEEGSQIEKPEEESSGGVHWEE